MVLENGLVIHIWEWNEKAKELGLDKHPNAGLIAQDVEHMFPEAVIKDENGYTPLMLSALYNQPETARYLLENPGTFVNFKENYNATALCVASIWGNTDVSEILIEYGADPTTPCFNPAAPIENACRANLSEEILSQYKEIAEFYDIEYDEGKIQEGRDKCLDFFEQQRLNS